MIHHVFACKTNVGDWLSARGIQALLSPLEVVEHLCDEPFVPETLDALARLSREDLVVIGGGGLLMDYFAPFWKGFEPLAGRIRFCIWGVGCCDLKHKESRVPRKLIQRIVRQSRLTVVRDDLTRDYLDADKIGPPIPCPSMIAIDSIGNEGHGLLHTCHYDDVGAAAYERVHLACEEFAGRTGRPYRQTDNNIEQPTEAALRGALQRYATADLIVSSRLHGCIIAVAMGKKVLALAADRKVDAFMKMAGLDAWVCDVSGCDSVGRRLEQLERQPSVRSFVANVRHQNRGVAQSIRMIADEFGC